MKHLILLLPLLLVSCVNLNFDSGEYDRYISIKEQILIVHTSCGTPNVVNNLEKLHTMLEHQLQYSTHRVQNTYFAKSTSIINNMVIDMQSRYKHKVSASIGYCKLKTNDMLVGTSIIIQEMGKL